MRHEVDASAPGTCAGRLLLDPFQAPTPEERTRLRSALARHFPSRDGEPDRARGVLPRREAFFAALEPVVAAPVDPEAQTRFSDRPAPPGLDPRLLWTIAVDKANRGEAYGVDYELARLARRGFAGVDPHFLHVALEERYHTRLLEEACAACGGTFSIQPPPPTMRALIRTMSWLPERIRFLLILCGETVGAHLFGLLVERSAAFADEPAVAERLELLLGEIWRDELVHVAYCRSRLHPWLLPLGRLLRPWVARSLLGQVPEFAALGGGRRATLARVARPLALPDELAWAATPAPGTVAPASGPRLAPLTLARLARDPLALFQDLARTHGDVVRLGFGGFHLVTHPDGVERVLVDPDGCYGKGEKARRRVGEIFGRGLVLEEGRPWAERRRRLAPSFGARAVESYVPAMAREARALRARWEIAAAAGQSVDVKAAMKDLTQEIVASALLGARAQGAGAGVDGAMAELGRYVAAALRAPVFVPSWVPTPGNRRMRRAVRVLDGFLERLVDGGSGAEGLLGPLREAHGTGPAGRRAIRDDLVTFFVAGHDTSASALAWTLHLLSRHPAVRRRLVDEVRAVLGDRPPTARDLPRLRYVEAVVREALRLYPPAWMLAREALRDDVLAGRRIPAGATVLVSAWVTQRRADLWPAPEVFDPERFAPGAPAERARFAWFPFGGGPRVCVGASFAMAEMKLVLAVLHQRVELQALDARAVRPIARMTLEPAGELRLLPRRLDGRVRARRTASADPARSRPAAHTQP